MIDQKGMFNNIYKNLVTPILKKDAGIDAEYLTNFSLSLLTFSSKNRNWPLISRVIKSLNQEFCVVDKRLHQKICGIDFCNPVGLAAGFDKNGNAVNIWKDFVAKAVERSLADFKNPYDTSESAVTHGGGITSDVHVGYNRMLSPGLKIQVMTCVKTPCSGSRCQMPNHLCSDDIILD